MKLIKLLSAFLAVVALIFILVIGLNWTAFHAIFADRESFSEGSEWIEKTYSLAGLSEYIQANQDVVSIVSINLSDASDNIILNPEVPRMMGATSNLFLIMEFARQKKAGSISLQERVEVAELNRFIVPGWYENGHRNAMRNVNVENGTISIEDVLTLITRHFSQPASDWLFFRLGPGRVNRLIRDLTDDRVEPWVPGSGIQVAIILRELNLSKEEAVANFLELPVRERMVQLIDYAAQFSEDAIIREEVNNRALGLNKRLLSDERRIHGLWSRGQPGALVDVLKMIEEGGFLDEDTSAFVKSWFDWAGEERSTQRHTSYYGALHEARLGYLGGLDIGTSIYTGHTYVQGIFFDNLPISFWMHMSSNHMIQDFQRRLVFDPEMRRLAQLASETEEDGTILGGI